MQVFSSSLASDPSSARALTSCMHAIRFHKNFRASLYGSYQLSRDKNRRKERPENEANSNHAATRRTVTANHPEEAQGGGHQHEHCLSV